MDYTQHYNLKKPAYGEAVDVKDLNDNADITDAQLNTLAGLVAARLLKTDLTNQIINDATKVASAATVYSVNKKADDLNSDLGALETNLAISNYTYYPVTSSTTSNAATIKGTGKVISIDGALTAKAGLSIEKWGKTLVGWVPEGTVPTNDVYCYMQDNMYILIDTQRQVWLCNRTAATKDVSNVSYLYSCTYLIQ